MTREERLKLEHIESRLAVSEAQVLKMIERVSTPINEVDLEAIRLVIRCELEQCLGTHGDHRGEGSTQGWFRQPSFK